jgi:hypothetical protein
MSRTGSLAEGAVRSEPFSLIDRHVVPQAGKRRPRGLCRHRADGDPVVDLGPGAAQLRQQGVPSASYRLIVPRCQGLSGTQCSRRTPDSPMRGRDRLADGLLTSSASASDMAGAGKP